MKRTLFICLWLTGFILFSPKSYGQQNSTLSIVYGTGSDALVNGSPGAAGFSGRGMTMVGLNYVHHIEHFFSIETGLEYSGNDLLWDYVDFYDPTFKPQKTDVKMLSVPVCGNFTFFKYLFLNAGFSVDLDMDHSAGSIAPAQSGIGIFLGCGLKYTLRRITLLANPFTQAHGLLPFSSKGGQMLLNSGYKLGIGYNF